MTGAETVVIHYNYKYTFHSFEYIEAKKACLTLERPRGCQMDPPIGFLDLNFEALKQSK